MLHLNNIYSFKTDTMKSILSLLALLLFTGTLFAQDDKTPYQTISLKDKKITEAYVRTSGGYIHANGADADPRVEVYIRGNGNNKKWSQEEIQSLLNENYELTVSTDNGKVTATARNKKNNRDWKKSLSISFKLYLPATASTDFVTSGGSIQLSDFKGGNHDFTTSGGSLRVERVDAKVNGVTSGGSIYADQVTKDITLTTSGGSIEAKNSNGRIRLTTSGGSLTLQQLKGDIGATTSGGSIKGNDIDGTLAAHTSGGSITMDNISGNLNTGTSGGHVSVKMLRLDKYVNVHTSAGGITLDLPQGQAMDLDLSGNKIETDRLEDFSGRIDRDRVEGKLKGGGVKIEARANSGRLNLKFH